MDGMGGKSDCSGRISYCNNNMVILISYIRIVDNNGKDDSNKIVI